MKTTAITWKKLRKIEVNVQVFAWQTEGSKNRDWPLVVIMQIEWQERTTSDSPKYSAKRSKAVCACDSRVSRGSLTAALAECESCLCNSCNSAYAWQWFVIHLRFESSLDFNAFLSISNAYLMPHATPHEIKPKTKRNKPEATMSNAAYVQCPQMQSSRAAILGVSPVPVLPLVCLPVGHFIVGPAEVPVRTNFSLLPALDASTSPSRAPILFVVLC